MKLAPKSDARQKLAEAINELHAARQSVADARVAEERARECLYAARDRVSELRAEADKPRSADALVAAIAGGEAVDILEMDKPAAEAIKAMEVAEHHVEAWRHAVETAEQAIEARTGALDHMEHKVSDAAKQALCEQLQPDKLIEAHDAAYKQLAIARARLRFAGWLLPHPQSQAILNRLNATFRNENRFDDCRRDPVNADLVAAYEALQRDADAPSITFPRREWDAQGYRALRLQARGRRS
jgi:phage shock protein A